MGAEPRRCLLQRTRRVQIEISDWNIRKAASWRRQVLPLPSKLLKHGRIGTNRLTWVNNPSVVQILHHWWVIVNFRQIKCPFSSAEKESYIKNNRRHQIKYLLSTGLSLLPPLFKFSLEGIEKLDALETFTNLSEYFLALLKHTAAITVTTTTMAIKSWKKPF